MGQVEPTTNVILVKIWNGNDDSPVLHFKVKTTASLGKVFRAYCDKIGIPRDRIRFFSSGQEIKEHQTIAGLNLAAAGDVVIIDAIEQKIRVSFRDDVGIIPIYIQRTDRLGVAFQEYRVILHSERRNDVAAKKEIRFLYNGECIAENESAKDLGVEEDDVIDAVLGSHSTTSTGTSSALKRLASIMVVDGAAHIGSVPDEHLLSIFDFMAKDAGEATRAAIACRRWCGLILQGEISAKFWERVLATTTEPWLARLFRARSESELYGARTASARARAILPRLELSGLSVPPGDILERRLLLEFHRIRFALLEGYRTALVGQLDRIRNRDKLAYVDDWSWLKEKGFDVDPFPLPTSGTTAYSKPDEETGAYSEPTYYDWSENWERVSKLAQSPEAQRHLWYYIESGYNGSEVSGCWDPCKVWPFLYNQYCDEIRELEARVFQAHLPPAQVGEINARVAEWHVSNRTQETIEDNLALECSVHAYSIIADSTDQKKGGKKDLNSIMERVWKRVPSSSANLSHVEDKFRTAYVAKNGHLVEDLCKEYLYQGKDDAGPFLPPATFLHTIRYPECLLPFIYTLAKQLSPPDSEIKAYASCSGSYDGVYESHGWVRNDYCVIVDEKRDIVFDCHYYFHGKSAAEALSRAKKSPQPFGKGGGSCEECGGVQHFDFALGMTCPQCDRAQRARVT